MLSHVHVTALRAMSILCANAARSVDNSLARYPDVCANVYYAAQIPYRIEITKFATDNDSIGSIICKRAEQLNAAAVVMAKHSKGKLQEFFVGSVTSYCK